MSTNEKKVSKTKKCAGKDTFERMNYLYQISNELSTATKAHHSASVFYTNLMVAISRKAVQRLDVDLKRTICKGCRGLLLAGITCKVRIKKKNVHWICTKCSTRKVFPMSNQDYTVWTQENESIVEQLEYK